MKKINFLKDFKPLSREKLREIVGGNFAECGPEANGALCPYGQCCSPLGYCGTGSAYCVHTCQCLTNYEVFDCGNTGDCFSYAQLICGSAGPNDYYCA